MYSELFAVHGAHQADNASTALCAVETFFAAPLADEVVREGFGAVGTFRSCGCATASSLMELTILQVDSSVGVYFDDFRPGAESSSLGTPAMLMK